MAQKYHCSIFIRLFRSFIFFLFRTSLTSWNQNCCGDTCCLWAKLISLFGLITKTNNNYVSSNFSHEWIIIGNLNFREISFIFFCFQVGPARAGLDPGGRVVRWQHFNADLHRRIRSRRAAVGDRQDYERPHDRVQRCQLVSGSFHYFIQNFSSWQFLKS